MLAKSAVGAIFSSYRVVLAGVLELTATFNAHGSCRRPKKDSNNNNDYKDITNVYHYHYRLLIISYEILWALLSWSVSIYCSGEELFFLFAVHFL